MQDAARRLALIAAGQSQSLKGTVRITASKVFAHYTLPPILAKIRQAEPDIQLELAQRGTPQSFADFDQHDMIGLDRNPLIINAMRALGLPRSRADFPLRCDGQATYWELAKAGCGIGATQFRLGRQAEGMVHILPDLPLKTLPVWLVAAKALRQTPRIPRIYDLLATAIKPLCDA